MEYSAGKRCEQLIDPSLEASPTVQRTVSVGIEGRVVSFDGCSDLLPLIPGQKSYPHLVLSACYCAEERNEDQRRFISTMLILAFPRPLQDFGAGVASGLVVAKNNGLRKISELRLSSDGHINWHRVRSLAFEPHGVLK